MSLIENNFQSSFSCIFFNVINLNSFFDENYVFDIFPWNNNRNKSIKHYCCKRNVCREILMINLIDVLLFRLYEMFCIDRIKIIICWWRKQLSILHKGNGNPVWQQVFEIPQLDWLTPRNIHFVIIVAFGCYWSKYVI